ncbi:MAG: DUF429 domain-containing protein [Isosphaeraceae bacterium]|nr:DUF429 domain-containing protein [Isosphaeraceae bacterium]
MAQPKGTASCEIDWSTGEVACALHVADPLLLTQVRSVLVSGGIVAIDAPFGWPVPFVKAIERHRARLPFGDTPSRSLRLRTTDQAIEGRPSLSVSSDRIAAVAFRAARLLDALGGVRRDGQDRVIEVYPAAALRRWKLELPGYERDAGLSHPPKGAERPVRRRGPGSL